MLETILTHITIWAPSLVAILGVCTTVVFAIGKLVSAVKDVKNEQSFHDLATNVSALAKENEELRKQNNIFIDELKKIKNYMENKK